MFVQYNHCYDCVFFSQKPTPNLLETVSQKQIGVSIFQMEVKKRGNENIKSNEKYK